MKKGGLILFLFLWSCILFSQDAHHFLWIGGNSDDEHDAFSWNYAGNWQIWIPETDQDINPETDNGIWEVAWIYPGELDNCIIPSGRSYYPKYPSYPNFENTAQSYNIKINPGGKINWESPDGEQQILLKVSGNLEIQNESENPGILSIAANAIVEIGIENPNNGNLTIDGQVTLEHRSAKLIIHKDLNINNFNGLKTIGEVTVYGLTTVIAEQGIVIDANETGIGSFINHGALSFSSYAGAKVETYISGSVGNYFMHFVGPTLLDSTASYRGGNISGVRLHQFDLANLNTNNYEWNALTDTTNHQIYPWIQVQPIDYNVPSGNGIAVSKGIAESATIEMVGTLISEEVSYNVHPHINNNLELVSNPFSAAISFEDLYNYGNNSDVIKGHYWIYDASTGNYYGGAQGANSSMIQVGQGFFVEVNGNGGNLIFPPSIRTHSNEAFSDVALSIMKMEVTGGAGGYIDEITIRFDENATNNYDENLEVKKWNSFGHDATMMRSITDDGSELSVNALPIESLNNPMTSIPIHFECGYDAQYTLNFSGIETFEYATSIWIEDLQSGIWSAVSETNPMVTFNGSPGDDKVRFLLHFMGPTAVQETNTTKKDQTVHIYSSKEKIYIRNTSKEIIKSVSIFNILGQEIYRNNAPEQGLNQVTIQGTTGYYVVHVRTDQSMISENIYIYN